MKVFKFYQLGINPIYRDLFLVLVVGILASVAIVTMGFIIYSQV